MREPPAPGAPFSRARWEDFIAELEGARRLTLVSLLQEAKVLACEDARVVIGFPSGSIHGDLAAERDKRDEILAALTAFAGRPMAVEVKQLSAGELASADAATQSVVERARAQQREEQESREQEARAHPMTRLVLDTFGATIKEVKTDV